MSTAISPVNAGTDRPRPQNPATLSRADRVALEGFDRLPGSAQVRLPVVAALFSVGTATIWRWSKDGTLPGYRKLGGVALWEVAALRSTLKRDVRQ